MFTTIRVFAVTRRRLKLIVVTSCHDMICGVSHRQQLHGTFILWKESYKGSTGSMVFVSQLIVRKLPIECMFRNTLVHSWIFFVQRATVHTSTMKRRIMKANGTAANETVGGEWRTLIVLYTKVNGMMTKDAGRECFVLVRNSPFSFFLKSGFYDIRLCWSFSVELE